MELNALRRLIESGQLPPEALSQLTISVRDQGSSRGYPQPTFDEFVQQGVGPGQGYMTNSEGARTTFNRQTSDAPNIQTAQQQQEVQVYSPSGTRLGSEAMAGDDIDYSRNKVDIAGLGKGYYSKDGTSAYLSGPGGVRKVLLGYDEEASNRKNDRELKRQQTMLEMAARQEQIAASQAQRTQRADPSADWTVDSDRGVRINKRTGEASPIMVGGEPLGTKGDLKKSDKADEISRTLATYEAAKKGLLSGLKGTTTGPVLGRVPAFTEEQQVADASVAAMAPVLKQIFRVAGEGVFTDKDQELLLAMIPRRTMDEDARAIAMQNIDNIIGAKMGIKPTSGEAPKPGTVVDGWIFNGGNAGDKNNWKRVR